MKFSRIDWNRVFFKTYFEKRSTAHMLVNFNRIWILHIAVYWFYTAYNSPRVYAPSDQISPSAPMTWSAVALGGAVSTLIMIAATIAEWTYIPTTWNNASHLTTRLLFLLVVLALTGGPTIYIAMVDGKPTTSQVPLIISVVQFFISVVATLAFGIIPSGRMFGDRVAGTARKYMASQTFTASYPSLGRSARAASIALWALVFGCKFVESYFFLTASFSAPVAVMAGMKVQACTDRFFGNVLCRNQVVFTLALMYVMDLVLFFLDTYLWYIIWNVTFSVGRSFYMGLSIWTPWKDVYTRLPKRIYAKLLATGEMEVKYKPKVRTFQHEPRKYTHSPALRSSFPKSGMPSSLLCTASTCCPLTTCNSSYTHSLKVQLARRHYVRLRSSLATLATAASSSRPAARRSGASRSLHNRSRLHCPIPFLLTPCLRSPC